jgi:predicted ribonuclease YlaK
MAGQVTNIKNVKILDTNIFLYDAEQAFQSFVSGTDSKPNHVVIAPQVMDELEMIKSEGDSERGWQARQFWRLIDTFEKNGHGRLSEGLFFPKGLVVVAGHSLCTPRDLRAIVDDHFLDYHQPDDRIIAFSKHLQGRHDSVELVTNDRAMKHRARCFGLDANHWESLEKKLTVKEPYKGWRVVADPMIMKHIEQKSAFFPEEIDVSGLYPNEYVIIARHNSDPLYRDARLYFYDQVQKRLVHAFESGETIKTPGRITAQNIFQRMYKHALASPQIPIVYAIGLAGCGKTLLALHEGLCQSTKMKEFGSGNPIYDHFVITRIRKRNPDVDDVGFLEGDLTKKTRNWYGPLYNNLGLIFGKKELSEVVINELLQFGDPTTADFITKKNRINVFDLLYLRGCSLHDSFWFIDDAQNLTESQVRDVGSRVASGTKVILSGDPDQTDLKGGSSLPSALTAASHYMRDSPLTATIYFPHVPGVCVRSPTAELFAITLKPGYASNTP